jgi:hypothetical protein
LWLPVVQVCNPDNRSDDARRANLAESGAIGKAPASGTRVATMALRPISAGSRQSAIQHFERGPAITHPAVVDQTRRLVRQHKSKFLQDSGRPLDSQMADLLFRGDGHGEQRHSSATSSRRPPAGPPRSLSAALIEAGGIPSGRWAVSWFHPCHQCNNSFRSRKTKVVEKPQKKKRLQRTRRYRLRRRPVLKSSPPGNLTNCE